MNLCEKCKEQVADIISYRRNPDEWDTVIEVRTESECEFWAHKEMNELTEMLQKTALPNEAFLRELAGRRSKGFVSAKPTVTRERPPPPE